MVRPEVLWECVLSLRLYFSFNFRSDVTMDYRLALLAKKVFSRLSFKYSHKCRNLVLYIYVYIINII